ncbi:GNAT family N-acetyltransferase [Aquimarina algicola]|uniref:GNAT family N-acetyltransferase n=1 Tax=Aquimarina algicola TaxID=2589995 RepID=A0A504JAT2_9FLAO|nr:GNAT family N-acetyltransferase [Aquimarina algicola]TPN87784.1 GNAT family N-acetyltransferase [Aquimarina algicola]
MIRKAKLSDLDSIYLLSQACGTAMIAIGIYQWNEHYPTKEKFQKDIELQELYILEKQGQIIGTIVLTEIIDEEYRSVTWITQNNNNLYIHRLAIHPEYWGKGYAQQLMDFGENYAKDNNYQSIRLDTFSQNQRNIKFYETRGYQRLSDIYFPKQSEYPFHCYELVL